MNLITYPGKPRMLKQDEVGLRTWNSLTRYFGSDISYDQLAGLTKHELRQVNGFGHKSFVQLNDLIKSAGYPGYNFTFWP